MNLVNVKYDLTFTRLLKCLLLIKVRHWYAVQVCDQPLRTGRRKNAAIKTNASLKIKKPALAGLKFSEIILLNSGCNAYFFFHHLS